MMINGHGFGPDYLIDAGATLIILIPLFFYILIRQFFNGHVTIVKVSGLIAFFSVCLCAPECDILSSNGL
ncbi:hypothetical protein [Lactiplantibacillus pentosus]|uniref:hypothetical protein n=1 Tax=Lactiplantibacillus pentosus TaxID=1589 RepID=UPI0021A368BD|nr:hypothetical protein [Lactiplantibacillus pentosus]